MIYLLSLSLITFVFILRKLSNLEEKNNLSFEFVCNIKNNTYICTIRNKQLRQATAQEWGDKHDMEKIFFTCDEARRAAQEFAVGTEGAKVKSAAIDSSANDIEEDDNFTEIVGPWSGEAAAFAVEAGGETLAKFGYWTEGEEMRGIEFDGYRVRCYVTDDEYVLNFNTGCGWARYPRENFTLAQALVDQFFLDCEDVDPEEQERIEKLAEEVTK